MSEGASSDVLLSSATTTPAASNDAPATAATEGGAAPDAAAAPSPAPGDAPANESKTDGSDAPPVEGAETVEDNTEGGPSDSEGAPETYQFEAPEGFELDAKASETFEPIARKLNLNNAEANELIGVLANEVTRIKQGEIAEFDAEVDRWKADCRTHELIGGDDAEFSRKLGVAKTALDTYGDEALGKLLSSHKEGGFSLGNHPAIIALLYRAGLPLQEDKSIERGGPAAPNTGKRDADVLWPNGGNKDLAA